MLCVRAFIVPAGEAWSFDMEVDDEDAMGHVIVAERDRIQFID
jgi:hypothetical protein